MGVNATNTPNKRKSITKQDSSRKSFSPNQKHNKSLNKSPQFQKNNQNSPKQPYVQGIKSEKAKVKTPKQQLKIENYVEMKDVTQNLTAKSSSEKSDGKSPKKNKVSDQNTPQNNKKRPSENADSSSKRQKLIPFQGTAQLNTKSEQLKHSQTNVEHKSKAKKKSDKKQLVLQKKTNRQQPNVKNLNRSQKRRLKIKQENEKIKNALTSFEQETEFDFDASGISLSVIKMKFQKYEKKPKLSKGMKRKYRFYKKFLEMAEQKGLKCDLHVVSDVKGKTVKEKIKNVKKETNKSGDVDAVAAAKALAKVNKTVKNLHHFNEKTGSDNKAGGKVKKGNVKSEDKEEESEVEDKSDSEGESEIEEEESEDEDDGGESDEDEGGKDDLKVNEKLKKTNEKKKNQEKHNEKNKNNFGSPENKLNNVGKGTDGDKKSRYVVFVGNLSYDSDQNDITEHFSKVGNVLNVRIPLDHKTNKPRGFAYVELENEESYQKALSMHNSSLKGRRINVQYTQGVNQNNEKRQKEIKSKNFKFDAMRKKGLLSGSGPKGKKFSQQRKFKK